MNSGRPWLLASRLTLLSMQIAFLARVAKYSAKELFKRSKVLWPSSGFSLAIAEIRRCPWAVRNLEAASCPDGV
jgi:hypothetical protein